jgi:hypothetical protein
MLLTVLATAAFAESPEYLLADLGVQLDLPRSTWHMTRWSDYDFTAKSLDEAMHVQAWSTPVQVAVAEPAADWAPLYLEKAEGLGAKNAALSGARIQTVGGRPVALVDVRFEFGSGGGGVLYGASTSIADQTLHVLVAGPAVRSGAIGEQRSRIQETLSVFRPPRPVAAGASVKGPGLTTVLPEGFREPFEAEVAAVAERAAEIGLDDLSGCGTALRPRPARAPDVLVSCAGRGALGVVDEFSFEAVEPVVRKLTWGPVEIEAAHRLDVADRTAFVYRPDPAKVGLAVGVVPAAQGLTRTWVVGDKADDTLVGSLEAALRASTWDGPHPVTQGETLMYYVKYRPTHPAVLGTACLGVGILGAGLGGIAWWSTRPKKRRHDHDHEH